MITEIFKHKFIKVGFLLVISAIICKFLGLLRDRLFIQFFAENGQSDLIYSAFRIPDFFFFLLISGTVSTLFIPRMADLKTDENQTTFFSSFWWLVFIMFGLVCGLGIFFANDFVEIFAKGFLASQKLEIVSLSRFLFGSVFVLALSSVISANLQFREKFISIALSPIFYTGIICLGTYFFAEKFGLVSVGIFAIIGAIFHFLINFFANYWFGQRIIFAWKKPKIAWKNFVKDFLLRIGNTASFQINQSIDIFIASFLITGAVTAFSLGSNLGHILLSIIGLAVANIVFPKFSKHKNNLKKQLTILKKSSVLILIITIPFSLIVWGFSTEILMILYNLDDDLLKFSNTVLQWTILSLPMACLLPIFSRIFLANNDTKTPTINTVISLTVATSLAVYLSLFYLPLELAILGLAIGNFTANTLSAILFLFSLWKKFKFAKI